MFGNSPPSGIFLELCHFARLYRHAADHPTPAEPGATRNVSSQITLQDLDELRAEVARGEKQRALTMLEHFAARVK